MLPKGQDFPSKTVYFHAFCSTVSLYSLDFGDHLSSYQVLLYTAKDKEPG